MMAIVLMHVHSMVTRTTTGATYGADGADGSYATYAACGKVRNKAISNTIKFSFGLSKAISINGARERAKCNE